MTNIASGRAEFLQTSLITGIVRLASIWPDWRYVFKEALEDEAIKKEVLKRIKEKKWVG